MWSIAVIEANFMLSQYNGRGNATKIEITPFPNMGDGLYGYVQFSINNNPCFGGSISAINGESKTFNVFPKYITLNGNGDTAFVTVDSSCSWSATSGSNEFSVTTNDNGFTITSSLNNSFENQKVIVENCDGLTEIVYVSQKPQQETSNMLKVNPQYITLEGNNKTFSINVVSVCSGNNEYSNTILNGVNLVKNGNTINGEITLDTFESGTFTVKNNCKEKQVTVIYSKTVETECSLLINGASSQTYSFTADTTISYNIESSSNWSIYSYDSSKVRCSKNGNMIIISLGEDKNETNNKEIILRNREGCEGKIIYSIDSGLVKESGVTFTFNEEGSIITTISRSLDEEVYTFTACVLAYNDNNEPIEWKVKSSSFNATTTNLEGGTSGNCKFVTFEATESTKKSKLTSYTIKLQEQETFKEISIKVTMVRPKDEISDGYYIEMSPESGTYGGSIADGFQVTVTPTYVYNGATYFIGDWDVMNGQDNFKGVSAKTTVNGTTIEPLSTGYDSIIYNIDVNENTTQFEICSTAVTYIEKTETSATTCNTISLSAVTQESFCSFKTDITTIEIGSEATAITYSFLSQVNDERAELEYDSKPDWVTFNLDEDGESITYTFSENESYDNRNGSVIFISPCEGKENITVNFKQFANGTIFIPSFDYLVVRYFWEATDGDDLDTVTVISSLLDERGFPLPEIITSNYSYINDGLGWSHSSSVVDANSNTLLKFAGDNTDNGIECVYMDFKNLCSKENLRKMLNDGVRKIHVDLYGNWFASRLLGNLDVSLIAYSGGTMEGPTNYNFTNNDGEEVYNSIQYAKVCAQGTSNASTYTTSYTHIGYVEYDITTQSAMLSLNSECEESTYVLERTEPSTAITISHEANTYPLVFISTKNGSVFTNVSGVEESDKDWLTIGGLVPTTTNPQTLSYTVESNTTSDVRLCVIRIVQNESNKTILYQIKQEANSASWFSFNKDTYESDIPFNLTEEQTEIEIDVYSCKNYDEINKTGNRVDYTYSGLGCASSGGKTESETYKYTQKFNIPTDCGSGTIILTQNETNNQLTITFSRECHCVSSETVNASAIISVETQANGSRLYEENGSYYINVICDVFLSKTISCGTATATIQYGLGSIDNAGFSTVLIENGESSGTSKTKYSCGNITEYDDNKPMDCISSAREGHNLSFTNNLCYIEGLVMATVEGTSLCQPCTCEVTTITISHTAHTFSSETEEKIFTLKVETDTCDSCTKGFRFTDPNGELIKTGSGEDTVILSYNIAKNGTYTLTANDDTTKKAYLNISKEIPYILSASGTTIEPPAVEAYVYIQSLKGNAPYPTIMFSESCDWITGYYLQSSNNGIYNYQFTTLPNSTTNQRSCNVTVQQEGGKTTTFDIVQRAAQQQQTPCMTIYYNVGAGVSSCDVYFSTTNGTQQGSHSNVSTNGSKDLCNIAEDTELVVTCSCGDVTLGGDTSFTYHSGTTASISLNKEAVPTVTGLEIQNNESGEGTIEIIQNGMTRTSALTKDEKQVFTENFNTTTTINVKYQTNKWCISDSCFVYVKFNGSNISPEVGYSNNVNLVPQDVIGYRVFAKGSSSCSGSIVCLSGDYTVTVNFIFEGSPGSNT